MPRSITSRNKILVSFISNVDIPSILVKIYTPLAKSKILVYFSIPAVIRPDFFSNVKALFPMNVSMNAGVRSPNPKSIKFTVVNTETLCIVKKPVKNGILHGLSVITNGVINPSNHEFLILLFKKALPGCIY